MAHGSTESATISFGLNWRRGTAAGAMASMIGGFTAFFVWWSLGPPYPMGIDPIFPGVLVSLGLYLAVSHFSRPVPPEALEPFFRD